MPKTIISTPDAPGGLASYSQAVKAGGMVYVSGMGPIDASTGAIVGSTIQEQTAQCLRNVEATLEAAGSSLSNVVWAIWSLRNPHEFDGFNEEWGTKSIVLSINTAGDCVDLATQPLPVMPDELAAFFEEGH